jgi:3-deoxy-manno-octulosonate cytidylyltransferase (CMP-KDO synthetase)
LAEKLLLAETGRAVIVHTCDRVAAAFGADAVCVCADDQALVDVVAAAGYRAVLTSPDHQSGTDRIAEVAATLDADILVNVQGDEPEIEPAAIRQVVDLLVRHSWAWISTLATPASAADQADPNAVNVICGHDQRALWFTRAPAVWDRDAAAPRADCLRHLGIYAYRRDVLLRYAALPASPLEDSEKLEQLRALAAGIGIACGTIAHAAPGIDVRADYDAFVARMRLTEGDA